MESKKDSGFGSAGAPTLLDVPAEGTGAVGGERTYWKTHFILGRSNHAFGHPAQQHMLLLEKSFPVREGVHQSPHDADSFVSYREFLRQYGAGFDGLATALENLAQLRHELDVRVANTLASLRNDLDQARVIKESREGFDQMERKYQHDLQKFLSNKNNEDHEAAKALLAQRQFLELQRFDLETRMAEFSTRRQEMALRPIGELLEAYADFCSLGQQLLVEQLGHQREAVREYVASMREQTETQLHLRRQARRQMEKELFASKSRPLQLGMLGTGIRDVDNVSTSDESEQESKQLAKQGVLYFPASSPHGFMPVLVELKHGGQLSVRPTPARPSASELDISCPLNSQQARAPPAFATHTLNLMLCTVKEDRSSLARWVFSVISPQDQVTLQADTYEGMRDWMSMIQKAIANALDVSPSSPPSSDAAARPTSSNLSMGEVEYGEKVAAALEELRQVEGNSACVDCGAAMPEWVSINLGVLMCMECSGAHRSLGTHITRVRSLTLDKIDGYLLRLLTSIGNARFNALWESKLPADVSGGGEVPDRVRQRQLFIRAKYEERRWMRPAPSVDASRSSEEAQEQLDRAFFEATVAGDTLAMLHLLFCGADVNWANPDQDCRTALIQSVFAGNTTTTEFLLQNQADLTLTEARGWTALHYAAYYDDVQVTEQILSRPGGRALLEVADPYSQTPIVVAEGPLSNSTAQQQEDSASVDDPAQQQKQQKQSERAVLPMLRMAKERLDRELQEKRAKEAQARTQASAAATASSSIRRTLSPASGDAQKKGSITSKVRGFFKKKHPEDRLRSPRGSVIRES